MTHTPIETNTLDAHRHMCPPSIHTHTHSLVWAYTQWGAAKERWSRNSFLEPEVGVPRPLSRGSREGLGRV